jgi:hypothetical protein
VVIRVLGDKGFHKLSDFFLLTPRKGRCGFEDFLEATFGSFRLGSRNRESQELINTDAQSLSQSREHFATRRFIGSLPKRDIGLGLAQGARQIVLT